MIDKLGDEEAVRLDQRSRVTQTNWLTTCSLRHDKPQCVDQTRLHVKLQASFAPFIRKESIFQQADVPIGCRLELRSLRKSRHQKIDLLP